MTVATLPTMRVECPACGRDTPDETWSLPGQLLRRPQQFEAARCSCGQAYLREQVHPEALEALYDADYPLHRGASLWGPFAPLVAKSDARVDSRRIETVLRCRRLTKDDRVLDLGCGRGSFLEHLHRSTGAGGIGVDAVRPGEVAGTPWQGHDDRLRCVAGTLPNLPAEVDDQAPFSVVTMWHALEHDPQPRRTLTWIRERLRPDGVLVVEVPDGSSVLACRLGTAWAGLHTPRHVSLFEPDSLTRMVEGAGFCIVNHRRRGTLAPYTLVALSLADRVGFRFGRHPAWALFPAWTTGLIATWPWLGRPEAEGLGLQLLVARPG